MKCDDPTRMKKVVLLLLFAIVALGAGAGYAVWSGRVTLGALEDKVEDLLDGDDLKPIERAFGPANVPHLIVLERGGATVTGGVDDSHHNSSSVVATHLKSATIPKFGGSDKEWRTFVTCLKDVFAPFAVDIVEARPADPKVSYVLVLVGGTPQLLGFEKRVAGLAPYSGDVVDDPIAFVFSKMLGENPTLLCETAAEEIGHTYGLDHEYNCKDPMTYLPSCRPQRFQDADSPCGEKEKRVCKPGTTTQNTYQHLVSVLGGAVASPDATKPKKSARPAAAK